jgi:hypothetical protein
MKPTPEVLATWTPLEEVAAYMRDWTNNAAKRPPSGSLVQLETRDGKTTPMMSVPEE